PDHPFKSMQWADGLLAESKAVHTYGGITLVAPDLPALRPDGKDFTIAFWGDLTNVHFSYFAQVDGSWLMNYRDNAHPSMTLTTDQGNTIDATVAWPYILSSGWHYYV